MNEKWRNCGFRATGENRHVSEGLLGVGTKVPLPKTEKSADLAHHFSGVAVFCLKNQHRTGEGQQQACIRFFAGEIPHLIRRFQILVGSFQTFPKGGYVNE